MEISLKGIASIIIGLVVTVVASACLGVSLATAISSINSVGEAWAKGVSRSVTTNLRTYYDDLTENMFSITAAVKANNLTMPSILISEGRANWTDFWVPFGLAFVSKKNYTSATLSIGFFDYFWTLNVRSEFDYNLQKVEWYENLQNDKTRMTGGGFLYHRENMTKAPFTAASNHYLEILMDDIDMALKIDATVMAALTSKKKKNPTALSTCSWLPLMHMFVANDPSRNFEQYCLCLINDINHVAIGQAVISLNSEVELRSILLKSKKSPNAEHFILQRNAEIIATTRPEVFWTRRITTVSGAIPPHCYSSILPLPNVIPPRLGCLATTDTFPFPPLNAIGTAFAMTDTYTFDFFKVDGTTYAIASERMTSSADLSLNTITIVPEQDLYLGTISNSIAMSCGLTVAVAAVAIGVSLLLLHFLVLQRLSHVERLMHNLAELHDLDKDEDLGDEQQEQGNAASEGSRPASSNSTQDEEDAVVDAFFKKKGRNKLQVDIHKYNSSGNIEDEEAEAEQEKKDNSWIAEVANLETAYKQTVRSMTNFTRYVSRAVVKELILQRRRSEDLVKYPLAKQIVPAATAEHQEQTQNVSTRAKHALLEGISDPNVADEYDVTVLIADIEGFSSQIWQTNRSNYDGVLYILHIYFKRMCRLIMGHGGVVDKFMGDSVMSYWGAPVRTEHHALLATLAALSLLRETRRNPLKNIFERTLQHDVKIRCGLASGAAIVGTFGNAESVNYSVVGAPVTQARHFQDFNKYWSTNILMDGNCMRKVDDTIVNRLICQAMFQPAGKPEYVYEVMGLNLDSRLARAKVSADIRTIAFTEVLSLPTMHANNEGVQEILRATAPEHESAIDALLNWHAKGRSALPASFVVYAEQFSEAARTVIEQRFSDAVAKFTAMKEFRSSSHSDSRSSPGNTGDNDVGNIHSPLSASTVRTSTGTESSSAPNKNTSATLNTSSSGGSSNDNTSSIKTAVAANPLNRADSSSYSSGSNGTELIFNLSEDQCLRNLLAIATIYVKKTPPRNSIDTETKTFFVRAFKLDAIEQQGRGEEKDNYKNNNNNKRKKDDENDERKRSKSNEKKEKRSRSRSGSQSGRSSSNNIMDTIPHQTQQQ